MLGFVVASFVPRHLDALCFRVFDYAFDEEVRIDVFFYRKHRIEKLLDHLAAVLEFILAHPARVKRRFVDHPPVRAREVDAVLEEVHMTEHMSYHHLVLNRRVGFEQKSV